MDGALRPRRRRSHRGGHDAPGDDPRRYGRRGTPGRRTLSRPHRSPGHPAGARPAHPHHCRRGGGGRVRHRRGEGHARPRSQRLRDGATPRPADRQHHERRCHTQRRGRPLRRNGPVRGPRGAAPRSRSRAAGTQRGYAHARGRHL